MNDKWVNRIITALGIILLFLAISWIGYIVFSVDQVKPGQVWVYDVGDPFSGPKERLVIDVKDGWVQYVDVEYKGRKIFYHSTKKAIFTTNSTLKEEDD